MPGRLPIYDLEDEIIAQLAATRRLVLQAPTGSGKSTQVPQMLLRHGLAGDGRIVTLQPRRLAARLLARRVAQEMKVELGREVGYQGPLREPYQRPHPDPVRGRGHSASAMDCGPDTFRHPGRYL